MLFPRALAGKCKKCCRGEEVKVYDMNGGGAVQTENPTAGGGSMYGVPAPQQQYGAPAPMMAPQSMQQPAAQDFSNWN